MTPPLNELLYHLLKHHMIFFIILVAVSDSTFTHHSPLPKQKQQQFIVVIANWVCQLIFLEAMPNLETRFKGARVRPFSLRTTLTLPKV